METVLLVSAYLAGVPFAAGVFGEKCGKVDWTVAVVLSVLSWVTVVLFLSLVLAMFAATKIYRAGMWVSDRLGAMDW